MAAWGTMSDPPVGDGNLRPDAEQAFAHHLRELAVQHARRAHWRKNSLETPNDVAVYSCPLSVATNLN